MFNEVNVRGLLIMRRLAQGGTDAERSLLLVALFGARSSYFSLTEPCALGMLLRVVAFRGW
jgi:hypothetical protein